MRYYSYAVYKDSFGVNYFSRGSSEEMIYAFSTYAVIFRKLKKIQEDRATGVIVVYLFTTQQGLSRLLKILFENALMLPKYNTSFCFLIEERKRQQFQM